jgi:hypothetical protein
METSDQPPVAIANITFNAVFPPYTVTPRIVTMLAMDIESSVILTMADEETNLERYLIYCIRTDTGFRYSFGIDYTALPVPLLPEQYLSIFSELQRRLAALVRREGAVVVYDSDWIPAEYRPHIHYWLSNPTMHMSNDPRGWEFPAVKYLLTNLRPDVREKVESLIRGSIDDRSFYPVTIRKERTDD